MRIRSTKPEFWRSARIASVSWDARLVLKGLESYVDDNGVGKDDIALIVGDIFPRDMFANPRDTLARVSEAISHLHQAGLLHRYEVDGAQFLFVSWWEDVQRVDKPNKGRFPRPDGTMDYRASVIRGSLARVPETLAPGTGEQGNRGTEEFQTEVTTTTYVSNARDEKASSSEFADGTPIPDDPSDEPPTAIETTARPTTRPRPTDSARQLVREVITGSYDRAWSDRIAVQVDRLARGGRDPDLIREILRAWEADPTIRTPEGIPSVANSIAKRQRAQPNTNQPQSKADIWQTTVIDPTQTVIDQQHTQEKLE